MTIKVAVAGFLGKMGSTTVEMVKGVEDFELTALIDPNCLEKQVENVPVFQKKEDVLRVPVDVWIDFTQPAFAYENTLFCIEKNICPVVGTTGFTSQEIAHLRQLAEEKGVGGLIAPNFSIGAVLMMLFAKQAAQYFSEVEIIELHHENKLDAPSGTAMKTAEMIAQGRVRAPFHHPDEKEIVQGARGASVEGIPIHSVRLPGLVAHQQVQFGAVGEGLILRHDSFDRISFMKGVELGVRKAHESHQLVYGLENYMS